MKTLYESLLDDFDTLTNNISSRDEVKNFIKNTYASPSLSKFRISKNPNSNGKYVVNVSGGVALKNPLKTEYLTNGLFEFGKVDGDFIIMSVFGKGILKSLEGAPKEISHGIFRVSDQSLTSLEGGPEIVSGEVILQDLDITSLKGSPKVSNGLYISKTKIKNFEGLPKQIKGDITCDSNPELVSLEGLPKRIRGELKLANNGKSFDLDVVKKYTDADWYNVRN